MLWTFYTSTISYFPSHENLQSAGAIGGNFNSQYSPGGGKLPNFNVVKMSISPPIAGAGGPEFQLTSA